MTIRASGRRFAASGPHRWWLVDDTFSTGAHTQSAASAQQVAAERLAIVPICRIVDPDFTGAGVVEHNAGDLVPVAVSTRRRSDATSRRGAGLRLAAVAGVADLGATLAIMFAAGTAATAQEACPASTGSCRNRSVQTASPW